MVTGPVHVPGFCVANQVDHLAPATNQVLEVQVVQVVAGIE